MKAREIPISIISNTSEVLLNVKDIRKAGLLHNLVVEILFPCRAVLDEC
jgi:hypothetical protein